VSKDIKVVQDLDLEELEVSGLSNQKGATEKITQAAGRTEERRKEGTYKESPTPEPIPQRKERIE